MAKKLKKLLKEELSGRELELLVSSYDVVGDIAVVIVPDALGHRAALIGETILRADKRVRVVAKRVGQYAGEFRLLPLKTIAGENRFETTVVEYGLRFQLNLETCYYSVRSGAERQRVAKEVQAGEEVLVLFSGVAPYPLTIAKYSDARFIAAIEKNQEAHAYALKNHRRNGSPATVNLYNRDAATLEPSWTGRFSRVVMPLPHGAEAFLGEALRMLAAGGHLHYYLITSLGMVEAKKQLVLACSRLGRQVLHCRAVRCGHTAPRSYRVCIDATIG